MGPEVTAIGRRRALAMGAVLTLTLLLAAFPVAVAWLPAFGVLVPVLGLLVAAMGVLKVVAALAGALAELLARRPGVAAASLE